MDSESGNSKRGRAALLALVIAVVVTALYFAGLSVVEQVPPAFERGVPALLIPIVLIAIPFLLLAFLNVMSKTPWLAGIGLTVILWSWVVYDAYIRRIEESGASIGMGLMVLVSPIVISAACLFAARKELRR